MLYSSLREEYSYYECPCIHQIVIILLSLSGFPLLAKKWFLLDYASDKPDSLPFLLAHAFSFLIPFEPFHSVFLTSLPLFLCDFVRNLTSSSIYLNKYRPVLPSMNPMPVVYPLLPIT